MEDLIKLFPKIDDLNSVPIEKRYLVISRLPLIDKIKFVEAANKLSQENYYDFLKDKRVAIIGPAPSVKCSENGDEIEKYDIIIRINKQWKHSNDLNKYIGSRTDILYNCLNPMEECGGKIDFEYCKEKGIKLIIDPIMYTFQKKTERDIRLFGGVQRVNEYVFFHFHNRNLIPFGMINPDMYRIWDKSANTRINTGLLAVIDVLHSEAKEVYVKGFTFFKDGYLLDYRNTIFNKSVESEEATAKVVNSVMNKYNNHNQEYQWKFFKNLIINETIQKKLKMDPILNDIINSESF